MILLAILLYIGLQIIDSAAIGTAFCFLLSPPHRLISNKRFAVILFFVFVLQDLIMWIEVASMDLRIYTGNSTLMRILGTDDFSAVIEPSFSFLDLLFYSFNVALALIIGKLVVRKYREKYNIPNKTQEGIGEELAKPSE